MKFSVVEQIYTNHIPLQQTANQEAINKNVDMTSINLSSLNEVAEMLQKVDVGLLTS